jgi:RNA polymerase sigma-70 factor, ECF subfamily
MKTHPKNSPALPTPASVDREAARTNRSNETAHDAGLVQRFKAGDESAFTEIVQRHYARIRSLALQTVHNLSDAEEVAQDTFIRAHRNLGNFRGDCSLATWLHCIGLNLARNRYWFNFRRRRQDMVSLDQTTAEDSSLTLASLLSDGTAAPRTETATGEFVALVAQCMQRLEAPHREILTMRNVLSLSYEEIAAGLNISVGTVKSRVARARERLRALLFDQVPEFGREAALSDFFETDRPLSAPGGLVMA